MWENEITHNLRAAVKFREERPTWLGVYFIVLLYVDTNVLFQAFAQILNV